jgi:alginate O-acetyltransferase complex protein AlgI
MLFNSFGFIFLFLPVTLLGFYLIGKRGSHRLAISWLIGASLFFYGWWNPIYLWLIIGSALFNYTTGVSLVGRPRKPVLVVGVITNLGLLSYFKYANFFIENINIIFGADIIVGEILLPLAISFFTFQQITYLIDSYNGETKGNDFLQYFLFVTFFPQLIAGPIVYHKEIVPQFAKDVFIKLKAENLAIGLTIFLVGLFKKVVLADGIAQNATPVFDAAEQGMALTFFEAWGGTLAYTFQLYFDFSGYSEMAIGLSRMFGVLIPANFFSPYKAHNIIDFWRRWHMSLSRVIRDYLFFPQSLILARHVVGRSYNPIILFFITMMVPTMVTFFWVGLWHGPDWNYIIFGLMHGGYLVINQAWLNFRSFLGANIRKTTLIGRSIARLITFTAVAISLVSYGASSLEGAVKVYEGMLGMNGFSLPGIFASKIETLRVIFPGTYIVAEGFNRFGSAYGVVSLFFLLMVVWFMPNTLEWMQPHKPALGLEHFDTKNSKVEWFMWKPSGVWAILAGYVAVFALLQMGNPTEFLYFAF